MAVVGYENGTLFYFLFCRRLFFHIFPFPPRKDKLLGYFHVIRRCPPNKYIYLIVRLINGAPMPPAPLVIAHRKRKKKH
jgi:hypothetical protein